MRSLWSETVIQRAVVATCALLIALPAGFAQAPADPSAGMPDTQQAAPLLSPDQLNNLVAPVALYPDPLLSQVLAASTYPLEIVEAQQWLGQNSNLQGAQLMDAAKKQNWDPSVQALVAFPDALKLLANDVRWTTDLGNAFLAQQADVMSAVQRMRAGARANGKLNTTPQQVVTMDNQNGQSAIEIQPANPQVVYAPVYSPTYVWGPPAWGGYYDPWYASGFGFGFGPGIYMSSYFPGWGGWGGWGWGCGWYGRSLFLNTAFFHSYGYRGGYYGGFGGGFGGRGIGGRAVWAHDPGHRQGIPYPNRTVASQFNSTRYGSSRMNGGQFAGGARSSGSQRNAGQFNRSAAGAGSSGVRSGTSGQWRRFGDGNGSRQSNPGNATSGSRSSAQGYRNSPSFSRSSPGTSAPRSNGSSAPRSYSAPSQSYSAPRSYSGSRGSGGGSYAPRSYSAPSQSYSAPRSFSGQRGSSGGSGFSGGRSGGNSGFSGSRSGGGGGRRR